MSDLKPRFIEGAGFYKSGAIVESVGGPEYVACFYERPQFKIANLARYTSFGKQSAQDGEEVDVLSSDDKAIIHIRGLNGDQLTFKPLKKKLVVSRGINGTALVAIRPNDTSFNHHFRFSIFGSEESYQELNLQIREDGHSSCTIYHWSPDPDFGGDSGFGIDLALDSDSFQQVWEHVASENAEIMLSVRLKSPYFFAEWSPLNEGRLIKYLDHTPMSLENYGELPEHFQWSGPMKLEFNLTLSSKYPSTDLPEDVNGDEPSTSIKDKALFDQYLVRTEMLEAGMNAHQVAMKRQGDQLKTLSFRMMTLLIFIAVSLVLWVLV